MVKTRDGRPVKIEGLPGHPLNDGKSSAQVQGSLYTLYDPERLRGPEAEADFQGDVSTGGAMTWELADRAIVEAIRKGDVVLFTRPALGPSERAMVEAFLAASKAKHVVWSAANDASRRAAWKQVYGQDGILMPALDKARVILSVGADFLGTDGEVLGQTRGFVANRKDGGGAKAERLSRLYVAEGAMTTTGSNADTRIPLRPRLAAAFVEAIRKAVGDDASGIATFASAHGMPLEVLANLAKDLKDAQGEAVVLGGAHLPESVHASIALLNDALQAPGKTLLWNARPPAQAATPLDDAVAALKGAGGVAIFLGVNPVYDAPQIAPFLQGKALVVGHGLTLNETLAAAHIRLPSAHNLESWNDAAPLPGVMSLCQPMISPLFDGRQEAESLLRWTQALAPNDPGTKDVADFHDFVRARWRARLGGDPVLAWEDALRRGFVGEPQRSAFPALQTVAAQRLAAAAPSVAGGAYDVVVGPHHATGDGRFAGNAWLQELPCPVSKLVWDNVASIAPATAKELGVTEGDWITIRQDGSDSTLELPVLIQPGTAPYTIATSYGQGRTQGAGPGNGVGFAVPPLPGATPRLGLGLRAEKLTQAPYTVVRAQKEFSQQERPIVLDGTKDEYLEHPDFAKHRRHVPELVQMHEEWDYSKGYKWAMAIDLNACTGCNACTIACQAENNISVVGKEEVGMGREMYWIRIDRYERGDEANPIVSQQPMLCQHCDNAPCENVCPVNATAHSPDGLNEQVYNRCVGTRYCANNCPYKVRRFNFYHYAKETLGGPVAELMLQPAGDGALARRDGEVHVLRAAHQRGEVRRGERRRDGRGRRGAARVRAGLSRERHRVRGRERPEGAKIAEQRSSTLAYHVLEELNVRPNVTYLARVRNPAPGATRGEHDGRSRMSDSQAVLELEAPPVVDGRRRPRRASTTTSTRRWSPSPPTDGGRRWASPAFSP